VNNTGTKYVRIMKQTAFLRVKNGDYITRLKHSVSKCVKYFFLILAHPVYKM